MERGPASLILDASCLLNLSATERCRDIAALLREQVAVADYDQIVVDLSPLVSEGLVEVMRLASPDEEAAFVALAAMIDDGEAVTAARAVHRECSVATDDRKARRVLSERVPTVPLVSTLDLMAQWVETMSGPLVELRTALERMRSGASSVPGPRDPRHMWRLEVMHSRPGAS